MLNVLAINCDTSSSLSVIYIFKTILGIIIGATPIILVIAAMVDLAKSIIKNEIDKNIYKMLINRIVLGLLVFLIIPIHNTVLSVINESGVEDSCWMKANLTIVKELKESERLQREVEEELRQSEAIAKAEELEKGIIDSVLEAIRDIISAEKGADTDIPGYDGTDENGEWMGLTIKNGIFIIPNTRATSDKDIPKQGGNYGLNPIFWERLSKLINDAKKVGCDVTVTSGFRSYSKQISTWNNNDRECPERCDWVAYPGGSRHGFGIAADLAYDGKKCSKTNYDCNTCAKWVHDNAEKYYSLTFRMDNEPWHIEPSVVKGGSFSPKCSRICVKVFGRGLTE